MSSFDHVWGEHQRNGGPAFPTEVVTGNRLGDNAPVKEAVPGMTLRDYFAAKVMPALIMISISTDNAAVEAYRAADAMLAARGAA